MKVKDGDFVMPGEVLGIIEQYFTGEGTYDDNGTIKSSILGNIEINPQKRIISVKSKFAKPALLEIGDIIYGQISDVKAQRANVDIERLKNNSRPLALPYTGAIHISQAKDSYLDKLTSAFRIGDIIEAKVIKITGDNVDLSTTDDDCGVLKAMCTRCRSYMHTTEKPDELECNHCNKKEKREISSNYVNI